MVIALGIASVLILIFALFAEELWCDCDVLDDEDED